MPGKTEGTHMRIRLASVLGIWLLLTTVSLGQHGPMLMSPYLQAVTSNSIYVLVESSSADAVTVEYGPHGHMARVRAPSTPSRPQTRHTCIMSSLPDLSRTRFTTIARARGETFQPMRASGPPFCRGQTSVLRGWQTAERARLCMTVSH